MHGLSGRTVAILSVVALGLVGCTGTAETGAASPVGSGTQNGSNEVVMIVSGTAYGAMGGDAGLVKQFEDATGIKVRVVTAEIPVLYEKQNAAFVSGGGAYDVVAFEDSASTPKLWQNLTPLNDMIAGAGPEYNLDDFIGTGRDVSRNADGQQFGIPVRLSAYIIYYRSDLLKAAGYDVFPTKWEDLLRVAEKLTTPERAGMMQRGASPDAGVDFLSVLDSYNGRMLNEDNTECTLTSSNAIGAAETFVRIFTDFSPQSAVAAGRDDYTTAYQQGRSVMSIFSSSYYSKLTDPKDSDFGADVTGAALAPSANGADIGAARIAAWSFGIPRNSHNQDNAWQLIEFLSSPKNQLKAALDYGNGPARTSVYQADEYLKAFPPAATVLEALKVAVPDPATPQTAAMRTVLAGQLSAAIVGQKTAAQAMTDACAQINDLLKN